MVEYTNGPWEADGHTVVGPGGMIAETAHSPWDVDVCEANARLCAAAPDLLKWLEFLFQDAEEHADPNGYVELVVRKDEWTQILSAVRKARSEQP